MNTMPAPWILSAVKAALGEGGAAGGGASKKAASGLNVPRPKIVQVIRGSGHTSSIVVSDKETEITVFLTPRAREAFMSKNPQRNLPSLKTTLVKLERWLVSYLPHAFDSSGERVAHSRDNIGAAPICLQCSEFSLVGGEGCGTFGDPKYLNQIPEVAALYKNFPNTKALVDQLAEGQGLRALPDTTGEDTLPFFIDDDHPLDMSVLDAALKRDREPTVVQLAGKGPWNSVGQDMQAEKDDDDDDMDDGGSDFGASPAKDYGTQQRQDEEEEERMQEERQGEEEEAKEECMDVEEARGDVGDAEGGTGTGGQRGGNAVAAAGGEGGGAVTPTRPRRTTNQATTPILSREKALSLSQREAAAATISNDHVQSPARKKYPSRSLEREEGAAIQSSTKKRSQADRESEEEEEEEDEERTSTETRVMGRTTRAAQKARAQEEEMEERVVSTKKAKVSAEKAPPLISSGRGASRARAGVIQTQAMSPNSQFATQVNVDDDDMGRDDDERLKSDTEREESMEEEEREEEEDEEEDQQDRDSKEVTTRRGAAAVPSSPSLSKRQPEHGRLVRGQDFLKRGGGASPAGSGVKKIAPSFSGSRNQLAPPPGLSSGGGGGAGSSRAQQPNGRPSSSSRPASGERVVTPRRPSAIDGRAGGTGARQSIWSMMGFIKKSKNNKFI